MEHRILTVDLSSGKHEFQDVPLNLTKQYLGGRGLNSKLLFDGTSRETDPLGPENLLVIGAGLLTGTAIPSSSRFTISAKSPLTGGLGRRRHALQPPCRRPYRQRASSSGR